MNRAMRLPRALTENLVIRELDDETLVYDMERDEAHCLNQTAALVWKKCDGKTTALQAARALQTKFDASVDPDVVWLAVKQLRRFHLVESVKAPSVSRRDLVLKYAPAALVLLPIIVSITSPPPAQAASCGGPCISGGCPAGCRCSFSSNTCVPSL